jgi:phosphonate transport system substrate-binding protein
MITRRALVALTAGLAATGISSLVQAQDWKAKYPEIVFAVVPAENATGVSDRFAPFITYLSKELGTKVTLRIVQDYAGVIEAQRTGQVHFAYHVPASFARAVKEGVKLDALAQDVNEDGTKGYYAAFYVKKDSPYQKLEDLKGKNVGLVDPNSTSGYNVPMYAFNKMGIKPSEYFGKLIMTGSHENAILALQQGTVDMAVNWWNDEREGNLQRMARKNMVKAEDFRIIMKSDMIVNAPWAALAELPPELKKAFQDAMLNVHTKAPEAYQKLTDGKGQPYQPVANSAFDPVIELITFVDGLRKKL